MRKITSLNPIRRVLCFLFWPYVIIFATISKNHHDSLHETSKTWLQCFVIPINYSCWTGLEKWRHQLNWVRNININIYTHCSPCQVAFTAIINWISVILKFSVFGKADLFSSPWPLTDKTKTFTIMYAVFIQITLSPIAKMTVSEGSLLIRLVCLVFFPHTI